ncbi:Phospho-2-dehydro-3-deoxyheptonate aldolase [Symbiodinium microadriaticum]|uniref:3-deoxy-7-phosphoheptulonate synthase n=1 Tax=Symbiodinium microadriaticum TaxID=2951 RepID=A0A1Q9EBK2_SYMMI|nr:Phospho-2-dehydro-3-deoxyheptonate aldolase [Symbiodinium microadriaticum]CAE7726454.1 aroG [Symbiodinium microadriaticum]CAE7945986.1 aroG [Symbiodinium sp. KB8]
MEARRRNSSVACSCAVIAAAVCLLSAWHRSVASPSGLERTFKRLLTPAELLRSFPLPYTLKRLVNESRAEAAAILQGEDDRLIAVVGPCSIHDPEAARDYARRLREVKKELEDDLLIIMRTYLEKPRTSVGWRGLVSDPDLSGKEDLGRGLALGRRVLLDMNALGLPTAVEFLDPNVAPYIEDAVTYGSIGARTVESPIHRALAASLKMPMGFKNGRSGDIQDAVNAAVAASSPQKRLAPDRHGRVRIVQAEGNPAPHIVLRGAESGPNFGEAFVAEAGERLSKAGFRGAQIMIDCSHGNSRKKYEGEVVACRSVAEQVSAGNTGIGGVLIESFLVAGNQKLDPGVTKVQDLKYGCSVTDSCMDFNSTKDLLGELAAAVVARRAKVSLCWKEARKGEPVKA